MRRTQLVHFVPSSLVWPLFGFVFQALNHEVLQLHETDRNNTVKPSILNLKNASLHKEVDISVKYEHLKAVAIGEWF